ncbi:hypothetical protein TNCV_2527101 [Trichonephila clavipes]|nr:hypothetical protein TNCV_2527101 [Trichonephila clavipes]
MAVRSKPECVTVPYIISANDPENYYYSHLLQYVPYRPEYDFSPGGKTNITHRIEITSSEKWKNTANAEANWKLSESYA